MTGAYESIIGIAGPQGPEKFLLQTPASFEVAKKDMRLSAAVIDVDEQTGKARGIERLLVPDAQ